MTTKDWKKTGKGCYKKSTGMAIWIEHTRGYNKYINEKGFIVFIGKTIPGRALYLRPRTESQALEYAKNYMKKH